MTRVTRAHFDGKVIVPDEPVDLLINTPLEIRCARAQDGADTDASALIEERLAYLSQPLIRGLLVHRGLLGTT